MGAAIVGRDKALTTIRKHPVAAVAATNAASAALFLYLYARAKGFSFVQLLTYGAVALTKAVAPGVVTAQIKVRVCVRAHHWKGGDDVLLRSN